MDRVWGALVCAIAIAAVLAGMALAWRARKRRQSGLDAVPPVPADAGATLLAADGLYLSTTRAGQPLERIAAGGLGFRAGATVEVREGGVTLALDGVPERFIPRADVLGAGRATWTIDRVVERDGLAVVRWRLAGEELETQLRVDDPAALVAAVDRLATPREDT